MCRQLYMQSDRRLWRKTVWLMVSFSDVALQWGDKAFLFIRRSSVECALGRTERWKWSSRKERDKVTGGQHTSIPLSLTHCHLRTQTETQMEREIDK